MDRFKHVYDFYGALPVDNAGMTVCQKTSYPSSESRYIYVIRCRDCVKIGIARDVAARLNQLQCGNPYDLEVLREWDTNRCFDVERALHARLDRYRVRGEWYRLPGRVLSWLLRCDMDRVATK